MVGNKKETAMIVFNLPHELIFLITHVIFSLNNIYEFR